MAERVGRLRWPEHPGGVALYGTGDSAFGPWLAMRLLRGDTLEREPAALDQVAAALAQAHAAGLVHGNIVAHNVFVQDGRAVLSDFGLADHGTAQDDLRALDRLRESAPVAPHDRIPAHAVAPRARRQPSPAGPSRSASSSSRTTGSPLRRRSPP